MDNGESPEVRSSFSPSGHSLAVVVVLHRSLHTLHGLLTSKPTGATTLSLCSLNTPVSLKSLSITVVIVSVHNHELRSKVGELCRSQASRARLGRLLLFE
jgi:hypothetical protein